MSKPNCDACANLQDYAPEFVQNGVTTNVATSLRNNTGLNPGLTVLHKNCEDLNDANDCLVGRMAQDVETYQVCDWKDYMSRFVPNLYEVLKAMIANECGMMARILKLECMINLLMNGFSFKLGENGSSGGSYLVAGKGVSFLEPGEGKYSSDAHIVYIGGAMMMAYGNLKYYTVNFTDADGTQREGNSVWGQAGATVSGNELILEYRIKRSEYPQIASFHNGFGTHVNQGNNAVFVHTYTGPTYAYGQHGSCNRDTGEPSQDGNSPGTEVPEGWTYVQLRMSYNEQPVSGDSANRTPRCIFGVRLNPQEINC